MSKNKICTVCGKQYEYCGHCDKSGLDNMWKLKYCSENCRDIFNIIIEYANKNITIDVAKKELSKKNLNINLRNNIAKTFGEIMLYEEPKKKQAKESKEDVDNTNEEINESVVSEPRPRRRRRKVQTVEE